MKIAESKRAMISACLAPYPPARASTFQHLTNTLQHVPFLPYKSRKSFTVNDLN
jgi:hypothetical protein